MHFVSAAARTPHVKKFLMVSYLGSRRGRAPWWDDADWDAFQHVNRQVLPDYHAAKLDADECLTALAEQRGADFRGIVLRPGTLTDGEAEGRVALGHTRAKGEVTRMDVADVAVRLLEKEGARGWFDLLGGEEGVERAVERVVEGNVDCVEGEDVEAMVGRYKL